MNFTLTKISSKPSFIRSNLIEIRPPYSKALPRISMNMFKSPEQVGPITSSYSYRDKVSVPLIYSTVVIFILTQRQNYLKYGRAKTTKHILLSLFFKHFWRLCIEDMFSFAAVLHSDTHCNSGLLWEMTDWNP